MEEERSFTFEWRVKNFSMCPVEFGKGFSSPDIRVKIAENTEWRLELYPRGSRVKDFMSCFLRCRKFGTCKAFRMKFRMSVFPESPGPDVVKDFKVDINGWGHIKFISIDRILKDKYKYLPNDTFTVKCSMKWQTSSLSRNPEEEILNALSRENSLNINKCSCETIIPVQTKSVIWPIRKFRSLHINERITMLLFTAMKGIPSFYVTLFKIAKSVSIIEITRKEDFDLTQNTFVRCHVSVANAPEDVTCSTEGEFLLKPDNVWKLAALENWCDLDDVYFNHTGDVLYLRLQFSFSIEGKFLHTERYDGDLDVFPPCERRIPADMFTTPSTEPSVVSLRAGDQSFQVHKSLLLASSKVFAAMFENDMKEKVTGEVEISDVDPQTLGRMVAFLYSGSAGELSTTDCKKLYAVAHKYQAQAMINHCTHVLMSLLTVSNVYDILSFADFYGNYRLLKIVKDFIIANSDRILVSPDWKSFMENNPSLAAKVMYKMLIK